MKIVSAGLAGQKSADGHSGTKRTAQIFGVLNNEILNAEIWEIGEQQ